MLKQGLELKSDANWDLACEFHEADDTSNAVGRFVCSLLQIVKAACAPTLARKSTSEHSSDIIRQLRPELVSRYKRMLWDFRSLRSDVEYTPRTVTKDDYKRFLPDAGSLRVECAKILREK